MIVRMPSPSACGADSFNFDAQGATNHPVGRRLYWYLTFATLMLLPLEEYGYSTPLTTKGTLAVKFSTCTFPVPTGKSSNTYGGTVKLPTLCGTKHSKVALTPGVEVIDCP